jgi:hypothetical protein
MMRALVVLLTSCAAPTTFAMGNGETCKLVELDGLSCNAQLCWSTLDDKSPVAPHVVGYSCRSHEAPPSAFEQPLNYGGLP